MSEPMFPGEGGVAAPAAAEPEEQKSSRKTLLALGGVVAALVVVGGAFFLMNSSPSDPAPVTAVAPPNGAKAAPAASPTPQVVIKPASVTVAKRDPFAPLYPSPTATAEAPSNSGGDPSTAPSAAPLTPDVTPVTLEVKSIDAGKDVATVSVDGKKYAGLGVGDSFGGHYTLYSVFNPQCVGVLYGDQSVPVCLGKPVSVTP